LFALNPSPLAESMEGTMPDLASDLYLAAVCAIGYLVWIAHDLTANIVGHIGKPAQRPSAADDPRSRRRRALLIGD
jgi:hypothetical protein